MTRPLSARARTIRILLAIAAGLLAVLTPLTGCASSDHSRPHPTVSYTPVPDAELYRRIAALPHVTDVKIGYSDDFPNGSRYRGAVYTDGQENPYLIRDQANAILRQGVLRAHISIDVYFPGPDSRPELAPGGRFFSQVESDLEQRYGPQPGSGIPPASPPVPTPSGWTPPAHRQNTPPASAGQQAPTLTP